MTNLIEQLKHQARLWQGREQAASGLQGVPTGYGVLDRHLGGGGWPRGALTEILLAGPGIGELRLMVPVLRQLTGDGRAVVWVNPPCTPYAPALARAGIVLEHLIVVRCDGDRDSLWALEQALRNPACSLVMGWPGRMRGAHVRRLQLATEAGGGMGVLFRPAASACNSSPAHLRLLLSAADGTLHLEIIKQRGSFTRPELSLPLTALTETLVAQDSIDEDEDGNGNIIRGPWQAPTAIHS